MPQKTLIFFLSAALAVLWTTMTFATEPIQQPPQESNAVAGPSDRLPPNSRTPSISLRLRHEAPVYAVAFSPDGKILASGSGDGIIHLWDAGSGAEVRRLVGHREAVKSLTFAPDGKTLISGSMDRTVRIWNPATSVAIKTFGPFQRAAVRVALGPDSRTLAIGELSEHLHIWDLAAGKELRRLPRQGWISIVALSPDGKLLATGGEANTVALYQVATGRELPTFEAPDGDSVFWSAAFSDDGTTLAAARRDGRIFLWDAVTGKKRRKFHGGIPDPYCMAYARDGKMLALGYTENAIGLWEVATGLARCWLSGHEHWVDAVAFSPDGKTLASAGDDRQVILWDLTATHGAGVASGAAPRSLPELWADLALPDAMRPYQAILALTAQARQSAPFLAEKLLRVAPVDAMQIPQLIKDLDDPRFKLRQKATQTLEKLGELAEPALRQLLQHKPSLESRQRVERLLANLEERVPPPEQLQVLRALEALEYMDTAAARQTLAALAKGPPGSWPAIEAMASLERVTRRQTKSP